MQKYPIGIQSFKELRGGNYVYVDKTQLIHQLTSLGKYYFLSRPRRFGKSLLISTLKELYDGNEALFKGLWMENHWDFTKTNPTIVLYFNSFSIRGNNLDIVLEDVIKTQALKNNIELSTDLEGIKVKSGKLFRELIEKLHEKTGKKVVVLIDEYDKPLVDFLEEIEVAERNRDILKSFYGILKPADEHLEFVFLTGISKFSKVSLFSDLNNLNDISLDKDYSTIVGITQGELESYFKEEINFLAQQEDLSKEDYTQKIRNWYNGYSWKGESVYNPFSLLNFFGKKGDFQNFWFSTGTPTWLVKQVYNNRIFDFQNIQVPEFILNSFDINNLDPVTLLFQTGYLTIKDYNKEDLIYTMGFPNEEVRYSLNYYLLQCFRQNQSSSIASDVIQLRNALQNHDLEKVMEIINTIFSTLPYDLWQRENERFYHALIHITFTILGVYVQSEVHSAKGRCDVLIQVKDYIYAFEFKLNKSAEEALAQIENKGYLAPFQQSTKQRIAVGVNLTTEKKGVSEWIEKKL